MMGPILIFAKIIEWVGGMSWPKTGATHYQMEEYQAVYFYKGRLFNYNGPILEYISIYRNNKIKIR